MIQFSESIADAYVTPSRNISMPSMPGRTVRFLQGHAVIKDGRDMVAMLKRPDVKIILTPYARSWMETWFANAKEIRATVMMADDMPPPPLPTTVPVVPGWDPPQQETPEDPEGEEEDDGADSTDADPRTQ